MGAASLPPAASGPSGDGSAILGWRRCRVPFHFLVRFDPPPGKEVELRKALLRVMAPTRAEIGCLGIEVFESVRKPFAFAIHSTWVDEEAFDLHAQLPHNSICHSRGGAARPTRAGVTIAADRWRSGSGRGLSGAMSWRIGKPNPLLRTALRRRVAVTVARITSGRAPGPHRTVHA